MSPARRILVINSNSNNSGQCLAHRYASPRDRIAPEHPLALPTPGTHEAQSHKHKPQVYISQEKLTLA